jgi:predicted aspartyl protease
LVRINNYVVKGLVDTRASTSVMAIRMVKELGIMHLVIKFETSKIVYGAVTQGMGRIRKIHVKVGGVQ